MLTVAVCCSLVEENVSLCEVLHCSLGVVRVRGRERESVCGLCRFQIFVRFVSTLAH